MAVLGRILVSSAERLDLPDLLSIDSYAGGDWCFFLKGLVGDSKPFILKGFDIIDPGSAIGTQICSVRVADSVTFYPGSNAGAFYHGLSEGNSQATPLVPELRKNTVNYVYLTFTTFNTSADTRAFWDPDKDGGAGGEFTQDINTESVLQVQVNVSTGSFPTNTVPVAKVTVGPVVITAIEDARDLLFRLGSGGINPNPFNTYSWRSLPSGSYQRTEPPTLMLAGGVNPFQGADKNILTLKEWMDVIMSKLRELGGTSYWYDDASTFSVITGFFDAVATTYKSKGQWIHDSNTAGLITWSEDVQIKMTSDLRTYILRSGNKTLTNEEVMYIPMVRNQSINATDEAVTWTNSQAYVNTVGGALGLFSNLAKGDWIKKANDTSDKWLRVEEFYDTVSLGGVTTTAALARSIRLSSIYLGSTGIEKGRYDKGNYLSTDVVVSTRDAAAIAIAGGNFHWLAIRSDTIENTSSIVSHTLALTISEHDGVTAKVVSAAHGLVDGDRITISGTTNYNGTFKVEVETANIFYISLAGGPFAGDVGSGFFATVTTASRSTAYSFQEESANHGFRSDDTIIIAGTTNYNGSSLVNVTGATTFTIPISAFHATETSGTATMARMIVRNEGTGIGLVQGQIVDIGGSVADNIRQYLGMNSLAETSPSYSVLPTYNTLNGMQNYNSVIGENITSRVSKLTAMMADKTQDKTIKLLLSGVASITNTVNAGNQDITFNVSLVPAQKLDIVLPGSANNGSVGLTGTLSLAVNQAAYVTIDRNAIFSFATLANVTVANISSIPIEENTLVLAVRLATTEIWLWDGMHITAGAPIPILETVDAKVNQDRTTKLISGGTWSWVLGTNTLTWSANAFLQAPGLANTVNQIDAASAVIAAGQVAYVNMNRSGAGGSLVVNIAAIASVVLGADTVVIARRDGNDIIIGNHSMKLIDGESKTLYSGTSIQTLAYMGSPNNADSTPDYTNATGGPITNIHLADNENLTLGEKRLDIALGAAEVRVNQNQTMRLINGGSWSYVNSTGTLTWSANANVTIPGLADSVNVIAAGNIVIADGSVVYATVNRSGVGGTIVPTAVAVASYVQGDNSIVIARRVGSVIYLGINANIMPVRDGESKLINEDGFLSILALTAGENLTANQAVYISTGAGVDIARTAGRPYKTDAGSTNGAVRSFFVGFVETTATSGNPVNIIVSGIMGGFTTTVGLLYYLDPTVVGGITSTKPTTANQWLAPVAMCAITNILDISPTASTIIAAAVGVGLGAGDTLAINPATQSPYSITTGNKGQVFLVNSANGAMIFNLPAADATMIFTIKDAAGSFNTLNTCTLHRVAAEKIEFLAADYIMEANNGEWTFSCDATDWMISAR